MVGAGDRIPAAEFVHHVLRTRIGVREVMASPPPDCSEPADPEPVASSSSETLSQDAVIGFDLRLRKLVSEQPLLAVGGAFAVGYLIGRVFSR